MSDPEQPAPAGAEPIALPDPEKASPAGGPPATPPPPDFGGEGMGMRLLWIIVIAIMLSLSQTVLGVVTIIQYIIMLTNQRRPNERLAEFGTALGIWVAKAARYQMAASHVKPWPWTELD